MSTSYLKLSAAELKELTDAQLYQRNEMLMAVKSEVQEDQLALKAELNSRATLTKFNAMTDAEKNAIVQHIRAGSLSTGAGD